MVDGALEGVRRRRAAQDRSPPRTGSCLSTAAVFGRSLTLPLWEQTLRAGEVSAGEATEQDAEAIWIWEVAVGTAEPKEIEPDPLHDQSRGIFHAPFQEV